MLNRPNALAVGLKTKTLVSKKAIKFITLIIYNISRSVMSSLFLSIEHKA